MHMSDALLSPAVGATFWTASLAAVAYSARKLKEDIDEKLIPLMGVLAAFIFAAQMINFTIPGTGSSGHLGGGMILAIILGPHAGFIAISSVLIIQSLFFADGGILALGCNIWNLGFYPCFIAYPLIYRMIAGVSRSHKIIVIASLASVAVGIQLGAVSVVVQTLLSDKSDLPFSTFMYLMVPIHLAIGLVEGIITAGVINYIQSIRPEILDRAIRSRPAASGISFRNIITVFLIITVITGGLLSWFASTKPDGLEWTLEKIYGKGEIPEPQSDVSPAPKEFREKTALLPDYNFRPRDNRAPGNSAEKARPGRIGTSVSGIVGAFMVLCLIFLLGFSIKKLRRKKSSWF